MNKLYSLFDSYGRTNILQHEPPFNIGSYVVFILAVLAVSRNSEMSSTAENRARWH